MPKFGWSHELLLPFLFSPYKSFLGSVVNDYSFSILDINTSLSEYCVITCTNIFDKVYFFHVHWTI